MGETVCYRGPGDARDPSRVLRLPGEPGQDDVVFKVDEPVKDLDDATVARVKDLKGQNFDFGADAEKQPDREPFPAYDSMSESEVVQALNDPSRVPPPLAQSVLDYERAHENRSEVVQAAEAQVEQVNIGRMEATTVEPPQAAPPEAQSDEPRIDESQLQQTEGRSARRQNR